jgi:HEAT repeat protein
MLATWSMRHLWIRMPFYGEDHYRAPALLALKALGPAATPISPGLKELLNSPKSMDTAAMAFSMIGPAVFPALEEACRTTNVTVRVEAAILIARMKTPPGIAYGYSYHKSPINGRPVLNVGWAVVFNTEEQTLQRVAAELQNPDPAIRLANLDALRTVAGPPSKSASSILVRLLVDGNANVVKAAQEALKQADAQDAGGPGLK